MDHDHETKNTNENGNNSSGSFNHRKIRYAVIGLGNISQVAVLPAFAHAEDNSELVALVSGDPAKLKALRRKYKVPKTYSYEQFADCLAEGVDAVYIALPNTMHRPMPKARRERASTCFAKNPWLSQSRNVKR